MKRISVLLLVLSAATTSVVEASYYHVPLRYQIHYSPYALSYHNSGLVPGGVVYSPYAASYHSSGLVPESVHYSPYAASYHISGLVSESVRYSPYALSYHNSGLISDSCVAYAPCYFPYFSCYPGGVQYAEYQCAQLSFTRNCPALRTDCGGTSDDWAPAVGEVSRQAKRQQIQESREKLRALRKDDAAEVIRNYLQSKNIQDFDMDQLLKINNRTVSVDFVLRDRNIVIKYWNEEAIEALANEPEYKRSYYKNYKKDWEQICAKYEKNGDKVYFITGSDSQGITTLLKLCTDLEAG